jgi:hypothetical protein
MNLHHVSGDDCSIVLGTEDAFNNCLLVCYCCMPSCGCFMYRIDWLIALLLSRVLILSCLSFVLLLLLLVQPRTAKKLVLFVGQQDEATG